MSINISEVRVSCDGFMEGKGCPNRNDISVKTYAHFFQYEWGGTLEENIGTLFKTYHPKLDQDIWGDATNLDDPPMDLIGWTFSTDGISCDHVLCPECSEEEVATTNSTNQKGDI